MTPEERARITSNDYADLIIAYNGDQSVFDQFTDATVHIINFQNAIVHVPVSQITDRTILELGYSVMPICYGLVSEASLEASGIIRIRNIPNFDLRGQGVMIGIIDTGIDYTNPIFKNADNTTKIISIWDQTIDSENFPPLAFYGTQYSREQINEALQSETPFEIVPSRDEVGHGTMLAGVAAGNEVSDSDFYGVAPNAELAIVKLKPAKTYLKQFFRIPETAICFQENDILHGVEYLINLSFELQRPIAICLGLGSSQGAHDGRGTLSSYLSLQAGITGVAMVIAAGNEGNDRRHYYGTVDTTVGYDTVELNVGENEYGFSMEIWGESPSTFSIDLLSPSGEYVPRIAARLDENRDISFVFEQTTISVDYQMVESQSGDQLILVRFLNPSAGIWRFNVYGRGDLSLGFHVWLPMESFISDSTYFIRSNPYTTVLSIGNANVPITATAYNYLDDSLFQSASRGYTRLGDVKPDIAAPGVNIVTPTLDQGFALTSGTSVATAHTTGVAAMLLEWGIVRGNLRTIDTLDVKKLMIRGARRDVNIEYPNRDWGYGILDVYNIFESLRRGIGS
ncbi:MAG: hypothetical protein K0S47_1638 [Herbinix sp.]|jgi:subtilisin family serine protease|nr:hypothetical protein [Herbinix sp.]